MQIVSGSTQRTLAIGKALAKRLKPGDLVCLFGQLGAGKTVLAKGIASGLGINKKKIVSPSFVLIREYSNKHTALYHFDLYRLLNPLEILSLGYEEYLEANGVVIIEWADRLKGYLPGEYLKVEITLKKAKERLLRFCAFGRHYEDLLKAFMQDVTKNSSFKLRHIKRLD